MNSKRIPFFTGLLVAAASFLLTVPAIRAQGTTAFTYQGRLNVNGAPANGAFDFQFQLAQGPSDPADPRTTRTSPNVAVSNGLFVAQIDFGSLSGQPYWLDIGVRPAGTANPFTILSPRQQLTPTPYANFAARAGSYEGPIGDFQLSPNVANWGPNRTFGPVNFVAPTRPAVPPFTVNNSLLIANLNADQLDGHSASDFWKLNGNADTVAGAHYVGTSDNQPLELRANFQVGLRLEPGPSAANLSAPGNLSFGAQTRQMLNLWGTDYGIGVQDSTVYFRTRPGNLFFGPGGNFAWYAGGQHSDTAFDPGPPPVLFDTSKELMRLDGTGQLTVFGTAGNGVQGKSSNAGASGVYGENSGGGFGVAGRTSGGGIGVFGDNADPAGWAGNFNGNVYVGGIQSFGSQTRQMLNLWGAQYGIGVQANTMYFRTDNSSINSGFRWYKGGTHNDGSGQPGAGGTNLMHLNALGLFVNGSLVGSSDRNAKENIQPVDSRAVLDKVASMPVSEWSYKHDPSSRHVGPMAQDFYAAFGLGYDDKGIATVDADGVALAAIQGLNRKVEEQLKSKDARIAELEERLARLEKIISRPVNKNQEESHNEN